MPSRLPSAFGPSVPRPSRREIGRAVVDALEGRRLLADPGVRGGIGDSNDQITEAMRIRPHTNTQFGAEAGPITLTGGADVFMFEVELFTGVEYRMDIDLGTHPDTVLRLFDAGGTEVAFSDDALAPGDPTVSPVRESYIAYTPTASGLYYLGFSGFPNSTYNAVTGEGDDAGTQNYAGSLNYAQTYVITADPDDSGLDATAISVGAAGQAGTSGDIDTNIDVDMYAFTVAAGQTVSFDLDRPGGSFDGVLRLFGADAIELARNDDATQTAGEAPSVESYLEYRFAAAGTYFLGVSGFGNSAYDSATGGGDGAFSSNGPYTLKVIDGDANGVQGGASLTTVGAQREGRIDFVGDVDRYQITAAAGDVIGIEYDASSVFGSSLPGPALLRLLDASGVELVGSLTSRERPGETIGVDGEEPFIEYRVTTAGTYQIEVSSPQGVAGGYLLDVRAGDANDSTAVNEAIGFNPEIPADASIDFPDDVDMYRFVITTPSRYGFDIDTGAVSGSNNGLDSYIRLFDSSGTLQIAFNDDAAAPGDDSEFRESYLELDLAAGTYYLGVGRFGNPNYNPLTGAGDNAVGDGVRDTGGYSLRLTNVGAPRATFVIFGHLTEQVVGLGFSEPLDLASVTANDFIVRNTTTNTVIPSSQFVLSFGFANAGVALTRNIAGFGPLPDGNYEVAVLDGAVTDVQGNANAGAQGGLITYFLAGDANRDRVVNFADLVVLAQNYGQGGRNFSQGNFDYSSDGAVGFSDLVILAQRYNATLPAMAASSAFAGLGRKGSTVREDVLGR